MKHYIIKADVYTKLKYIQVSLDIYISTYILLCRIRKKEEINISTMKTHQMSNKWKYLTCIKVSFANQNLKKDIVTTEC